MSRSLEIRFPLGPADGLLLSWAPGPERALRGSWSQAINFNLPILSQAEHQAFSHPDHLVAVGTTPWATSLATELLPGYSDEAARTSDHRRRVLDVLTERIERDPGERAAIPIVRPRSSGALAA